MHDAMGVDVGLGSKRPGIQKSKHVRVLRCPKTSQDSLPPRTRGHRLSHRVRDAAGHPQSRNGAARTIQDVFGDNWAVFVMCCS